MLYLNLKLKLIRSELCLNLTLCVRVECPQVSNQLLFEQPQKTECIPYFQLSGITYQHEEV